MPLGVSAWPLPGSCQELPELELTSTGWGGRVWGSNPVGVWATLEIAGKPPHCSLLLFSIQHAEALHGLGEQVLPGGCVLLESPVVPS